MCGAKVINRIRVYPRDVVKALLRGPVSLLEGTAIISIYSYENGVLIDKNTEGKLKIKGIPTLGLSFTDVTPYKGDLNELTQLHQDVYKAIFTREQARKTIAFLKAINQKNHIHTLTVHCAAGISRSGAVGLFACRYFGLDENLFRAENPYIAPNDHVYQLLYVESGMRQKYVDFWSDSVWMNIPIDPEIDRMFR